MNMNGAAVEDPVTGSLNASVAQWLLSAGYATAPYVAAQGTALGRRGRAHISQDEDGTIWVGGGTVTCVSGQVELPARTDPRSHTSNLNHRRAPADHRVATKRAPKFLSRHTPARRGAG